jgi:hypothetical protein
MSTKGNFLITLHTIHIPKAQACFPSNVHKNTSFLVLCTLSLESLCSSLTDCQAQQKVLAFSQTILANKTSHGYVLKDRLFCLLTKSDLLISYLATVCPFFSLHSQPSLLPPNLLSSFSSSDPPNLRFSKPPKAHQTSVSFLQKPLEPSAFRSIRLPPSTAIACSFPSIRLHPSS